MKKINYFFIFCFALILFTGCREKDETITIFPLEKYNQNITDWIKPSASNDDKALLSSELQKERLNTFYKHYIGTSSPWNANYVNKILDVPQPDNLKSIELSLITLYNNQNRSKEEIGYGENFQPHAEKWIDAIAYNINISQFDHLSFDPKNRAIVIENLHVRTLPTDDPFFFHYKIAGQGFPFDNLQMSSLWVGSPIYILGETRDNAWSLIITSDYIGWVKSTSIARVNTVFIETWKKAAFKQLAAIVRTQTSIVDTQGIYRFSAYVGSVFPAEEKSHQLKIMIPISDTQHHAVIAYAIVSKNDVEPMPLTATPRHFRQVISTLLGRPYGWGNMYFYNDCSAELKNLFTVFGIWLPRHSSDQVYAGKLTDLSDEPPQRRIEYLMGHGHPFTTLVYVGGHILLFVGNFPNPNSKDHVLMPLTFQNMWGLSPKPADRRAVIGKSVLFPLLEQYPEDTRLASQAAKKYFQVSELGETSNNLQKLEIIDLKNLMYP